MAECNVDFGIESSCITHHSVYNAYFSARRCENKIRDMLCEHSLSQILCRNNSGCHRMPAFTIKSHVVVILGFLRRFSQNRGQTAAFTIKVGKINIRMCEQTLKI